MGVGIDFGPGPRGDEILVPVDGMGDLIEVHEFPDAVDYIRIRGGAGNLEMPGINGLKERNQDSPCRIVFERHREI
jgi:hypothetical protein